MDRQARVRTMLSDARL